MKLGMLICDHVQDALQPEFGDYKDMFEKLLKHSPIELTVNYYSVIDGEFPKDINDCDAYMTSGSKLGVNDDLLWIEDLQHFIRELYLAKKGFVGICFGHQLIAKVLGGRVERSEKGWGIGVAACEIRVQKDWMTPVKSDLALVVSHQDQIVKLPPNSQVLLSNPFCPYSMIQVGDSFLGLQGHPEFTREYSLALMNSRKKRIPAQRITEGKKSLQLKIDEVVGVNWLINFLSNTIVDS